MRRQSLWLRHIPLGRFNPAVELRRTAAVALWCALIGAALALTGCAPFQAKVEKIASAADIGFRKRVSSVTVTEAVTPVSVTVAETINLREPTGK